LTQINADFDTPQLALSAAEREGTKKNNNIVIPAKAGAIVNNQ
jgi:hypothetical protein